MLSVSTGYDPRYLTAQVGAGREGYYLRAVREGGEPPGRWVGPGAEALGLSGEVDATIMEGLFGRFVDPRDERSGNRAEWDEAVKLGKAPRKFKSLEERLAAALAAEPDASPERVAEIRAQVAQSQRQAVHFLDLTFSPQKSVSVLWASYAARAAGAERGAEELARRLVEAPEGGAEWRRLSAELGAARDEVALWRQRAEVVWGAIEAGADAALDYARREAGYVRVGYHGRLAGGATVGRFERAPDWVVARFRHHESRDHDVQLHVHHAVLNRVQCADGEWRTLDSRAIHRVRPAAAAVGERVVEDYLSRELGVEWATRPDGKAREIVGVGQDVRDLFSTRRASIRVRLAELVGWYEERHGRVPDARALSRLSLMATLDSRAPKTASRQTREQQVDAWAERVDQALDVTLAELAVQVTGRVEAEAVAEAFDPDEVIAAAVARAQEAKAHWSRYDLLRALNTELPDMLGALGPQVIEQLLDDLTETALTDPRYGVVTLSAPEMVEAPAELRRADGESVYRPHRAERYATAAHLAAEGRLEDAATQHRAPVMSVERVDELVAESGLGGDQYAAVLGILTSGRGVDVLIGPPGTGKSYTVAQLAAAWETEHGTPVLGLATSQRAADVLAEEGVACTANLAKFLLAQEHLAAGTVGARYRAQWKLRPGQLVIVDEAGMTSTDQLAAVESVCREAGAKLLLSGDPEQLAAVGAGGGMRLLAIGERQPYALHQVRRFHEAWEREASLRLREHDASVLAEYDRHGRILSGTREQMTAAAVRGYVADILAGRRSLLIVATNEEAAGVSARVREQLVTLGRVEPEGLPLRDGTRAGAGDRIQARKNAPKLYAEDGHPVTNRDVYLVMGRAVDGQMVVRRDLGAGPDGAPQWGPMLTLPNRYVEEHVELAYAVTEHGAQGKTVDGGHELVSGHTNAPGALVGLTRGRFRNTAYVITSEDDAGPDQQPADQVDPLAILGQILAGAEVDASATETMREELAASERLDQLGGIWADLVDQHYRTRVEVGLRWMLPAETARAVLDDQAAGPLVRLMQAAAADGHDLDRVLVEAIHYGGPGGRERLLRADSVARVLHWRIDQLTATDAGRPTLDPGVVARAEVGLYAALPGPVAELVAGDEAAPALFRMVQAATEATGRDPAELVADAVHHPGKGGRPSLLENDAHGVTRLLHWRVHDRAGAEAVDPSYEGLRGAGMPEPDTLAALSADPDRLDGGDLVGAGQLALTGMPAPVAPAPDAVVSGAAVSREGVTVPEGQGVLDLDGLPEPSTVLPGGYADRTPQQFRGPVGGYVRALAEQCDRRAVELGEAAGMEPPEWAGVLGPVPSDPIDRHEWTTRVAAVAAYREHYGHHLPSDQPLGPCPPRGNVPARQAWHAAWDALGRPEQVREAATLTDAQLHGRVTAWRREQAWAPDYVGAELRRAEQAAAEYAARAEVARAELASGRVPAGERDARAARLAGYEALAAGLAERRTELAEVDRARVTWYAETTPTREQAEQAAAEMRRRGLDPERVTLRDRVGDRVDRVRAARARAAEQQRRRDELTHTEEQHQTRRVEVRGQFALDLPDLPPPAPVRVGPARDEERSRRPEQHEQNATRPADRRGEAERDQVGEQRPGRVEVRGQIALDLPDLPPAAVDVAQRQDRERQAERDRAAQARAERVEQMRQAARQQHDQVDTRRRRLADRLLARRAERDTSQPAAPGRPEAVEQIDRARQAVAEVDRRQAERSQTAQADQQRRDAAHVQQRQQAQRSAERSGPTLSR